MTTSSLRPEVSIQLGFPLTIEGKAVNTLSIRRPTVADMMDVQSKAGTPADLELAMVARLTGLSPDEILQLDMKDYSAVQAVLRGFTG